MSLVITNVEGFVQTVELAIDFGIPLPKEYYDTYAILIEERNNHYEN